MRESTYSYIRRVYWIITIEPSPIKIVYPEHDRHAEGTHEDEVRRDPKAIGRGRGGVQREIVEIITFSATMTILKIL